MPTRYTVSPHGDGFAVFDEGVFYQAPPTGTYGAAKKLANSLNASIRDIHSPYVPMLAKESKVTITDGHWLDVWKDKMVERKWDGMRGLFVITPNGTFIFSRTGQDLRQQYPELANTLHHQITVPCVLDGEIITLQQEDVENLEALQFRISQKNPSPQLMEEAPASVRFFDVLECQGQDVTGEPLWKRRDLLLSILDGTGHEPPQMLGYGHDIPSYWEGVVAKDPESKYECGKRRTTWLKYKYVHRATLRLFDLTPGIGARRTSFGAAVVEDAKGNIRGQVGSGFTADDLAEIMRRFENDIPTFIEVEYRFLSKSGLMVNTAFKGIRTDKESADSMDNS